MTRRAAAVTGAVVAATVALAGWLVPASAGGGWVPPDDTIVRVRGTSDSGFAVHHYDGTVLYLPTLSEATAECGEYDRRVRRVRCSAEVRTWYRDLGATRRALRHARGG